jgi:hypothetical protein
MLQYLPPSCRKLNRDFERQNYSSTLPKKENTVKRKLGYIELQAKFHDSTLTEASITATSEVAIATVYILLMIGNKKKYVVTLSGMTCIQILMKIRLVV